MEEGRRRRRGGASRRPSSRAAGAALRRKVRELRRLVPGGEEAPAGALLARTAHYILRLRARVELLRALAAVYGVGATPLQVAAGADDDACAA
ncbi:hypothetical protein BS78_07G132600 [Paspalum vaginatum]|nr:hypothetical protein BS78_07G132600 [Paspalum vaginatum]